jgi:hypothetical protein
MWKKVPESNSIKIISLHMLRLFSFLFVSFIELWVFRFMDGGLGGWDGGAK